MAKIAPGVIVYYDMIPAIEDLNDEQLGRLLRAMLRYGHEGVLPNFIDDPLLNLMWKVVQPRIDANACSYQVKAGNALYSTYCREAKKKGIEPVSYDFWNELSADAQRKVYENLSNGID